MNNVVRARIDQATKDEATVILDTIGLTVSDAFRLMMRRIVAEKRLPFDPLVPNATTLDNLDHLYGASDHTAWTLLAVRSAWQRASAWTRMQ